MVIFGFKFEKLDFKRFSDILSFSNLEEMKKESEMTKMQITIV